MFYKSGKVIYHKILYIWSIWTLKELFQTFQHFMANMDIFLTNLRIFLLRTFTHFLTSTSTTIETMETGDNFCNSCNIFLKTFFFAYRVDPKGGWGGPSFWNFSTEYHFSYLMSFFTTAFITFWRKWKCYLVSQKWHLYFLSSPLWTILCCYKMQNAKWWETGIAQKSTAEPQILFMMEKKQAIYIEGIEGIYLYRR